MGLTARALAVGKAVGTLVAGPASHGQADPPANGDATRAWADGGNSANGLMARHDGMTRMRAAPTAH